MNTWTPMEAAHEGWEIFETNHDDGGKLTIQYLLDYPSPFATDEDAIAHVAARAAEGSEMHQRALALHGTRTWSP